MRALESRRYFHERTGAPMPAYVVEGYVVEKARRDWDARPYRGSAGNPRKREWWEVRRQGSRTQPGVSIGPLFYTADTLRECKKWIAENPPEVLRKHRKHTHAGVTYYRDWTEAQGIARAYDGARVVSFERGWAVQAYVSGPYWNEKEGKFL